MTPAQDTAAAIADRVLALTTRHPRRALALAQRAMASREARDSQARARLLRAWGHALRAVGRYRQAHTAYRDARRLFARRGLTLDHAICALGLVDACMYRGRMNEALRVAGAARRVFIRRRDPVRLARLETNVGNLYHRSDALEPALAHYERAAKLFARVGSPVDLALVDHNRANILTHIGRRREAENLYQRAREALSGAGETVLVAQVNYGLACLRFLNGEYAAAIGELEAVRPELVRLGARPLLALADLDLAEVLLAMRLYPEALTLARAAQRWFKSHAVPSDQARCALVAGIALAKLGRHAESAATLTLADRLFRSQGQAVGRAAVWLARGQLASLCRRWGQAARLGLRARSAFRRAGFPARALAAGALAGEALLDAGQAGKARILARALLHEPRHPGDAYSRTRLGRVAAAAAAREGETGVALAGYRRALREANRARAALLVDEWRMGFLEEEPAILDEFLGVLLRRRPSPRPLEIWRWIARARASSVAGTQARPVAASSAVRHQAIRLRSELEACYARLWRLQASGVRRVEPTTARRLERRALALEGRLRRLEAPVLADSPRRGMREPWSLHDGEAQLLYFSAGGRLGALRLDARGWEKVTDLAPVAEVARLLRLFHYQMDVRGSEGASLAAHRQLIVARAQQHLAEIARLVIDPVLAPACPPSRLKICPHGPLFRVPFHALPWSGAPLLERCEVSIDPAAGARGVPRDWGRQGAWVIGYGGEGRSGIEEEARRVAETLQEGGVTVQLRTGGEARTEVIPEAARQAALIHLCGHAVYRAEHPEFSALRLADGWLNAGDLASLPLAGACVVLSACETGPRGAIGGEEMLGLVRGMIRGGAGAVLATLWRVDDRETLALMEDLYARWRDGGRLAGALREAQRNRARAVGDPYLWAPFALLGETDVPWPGGFSSTRRIA